MLSAQNNETLTRVGPGTPMGELMREYWLPICLSKELERDAVPLRLMLLGEKLIGFRDSGGRIGVMDHRCPHRCASLFFGRNEHDGIRCAYHGWKFDVDGNCLDMPNVPDSQVFTPRIKAKTYRAAEFGGLVWVYMGKRAAPPPLPALEVLTLPEAERQVSCHQRDCNWLQSMEGDIDTSHFGFLHVGGVEADHVAEDSMYRWGLVDRAPRYHVRETEWGTMYAAYRPADPGKLFYRFAHFIFPCFALIPDGAFESMIQATLSVPLDDNHTMTYNLSWVNREASLRYMKDNTPIPGLTVKWDYLPYENDWFGRWRLTQNKQNNYLIDRDLQRSGRSYSGIEGIGQQDQAMIESMEGDEPGIVDRMLEHLAPSDRMITVTRRRLLAAAAAHQKDKTVPPTVAQPELTRTARGGTFVAPDDIDWREAYARQVEVSRSPGGFLLAAE